MNRQVMCLVCKKNPQKTKNKSDPFGIFNPLPNSPKPQTNVQKAGASRNWVLLSWLQKPTKWLCAWVFYICNVSPHRVGAQIKIKNSHFRRQILLTLQVNPQSCHFPSNHKTRFQLYFFLNTIVFIWASQRECAPSGFSLNLARAASRMPLTNVYPIFQHHIYEAEVAPMYSRVHFLSRKVQKLATHICPNWFHICLKWTTLSDTSILVCCCFFFLPSQVSVCD